VLEGDAPALPCGTYGDVQTRRVVHGRTRYQGRPC
jgi:hypothetical protein